MAIKIDFVSDVSQITRDLGTLGDRLDDAVDEMQDLERAGRDAADGLEDVADAGKDLDRIDRAGRDAADGLEEIDRASGDAARDLGKVEDALEDVGDAGKDAGRGLRDVGDDAGRMSKDVEGEVDGMEGKVRAAFRNMADHARQNTGKIADTSRKDFDRAGDATETFKDEARSNLSETLSSFDGSLEGMVDGLQGTLGGVVADFGPAGMIGAGAIAAGIGVGMAYAENVAEGINEQGEIASALAEELRDVGGALDDVDFVDRMEEWGLAIQDNRETWELWQEKSETGLEHIADLADRAGTDFEDSFRGVTGTLEESQVMLEEVNRRITEIETSRDSVLDAWDSDANAQSNALHELKGEIEGNIEVQERAVEIEELRADAIGTTTDQISDQIDAQEELSSVLTDAVSSELDYLDTLDEVNSTLEENGKTLDKSSEKGRDNIRALIDLKDASFDYASAQIEAGESTSTVSAELGRQREAFVRAAEAAGYSTGEAERLADAYGLIPDEIITDVQTKGVDAAKNELNDLERDREVRVGVKTSGTESVGRAIERLSRNRTVTIFTRTVGTQTTGSAGRTRFQSAW
ncbi:hypothetical protein [Brachybacterium paraconglomeratum]|uniref:hypothetical protein n=1 Tax=Brachybacterium paraconglomeratum TaxID=173362 RepID=UPI0022AEB55B|nr:hypothetical protein [Brachybacterium paraconglomeratum]MCZ4324757.1 hypothetical protein [Brachybacterium paraconglomeratum]